MSDPSPAPVEQATAAPGERRHVRLDRYAASHGLPQFVDDTRIARVLITYRDGSTFEVEVSDA